jgi:hypothetical protein
MMLYCKVLLLRGLVECYRFTQFLYPTAFKVLIILNLPLKKKMQIFVSKRYFIV